MLTKIDWNVTAAIFDDAISQVAKDDFEARLQEFSIGPQETGVGMDWSVPEAFLAILLAAAHSDNVITEEEQDQLKGLRKRSRTLKALSPDQIKKALANAQSKLEQRPNGLQQACECLPQMLHLPVFTLAIDIVLADGKLTSTEKEFIAKLANWLKIDKGLEWQISHVMLIKNSC